jgi:hypothetical protein
MVLKIPRKTQTKGETYQREGLGFRVQANLLAKPLKESGETQREICMEIQVCGNFCELRENGSGIVFSTCIERMMVPTIGNLS